MCLKLKRGAKKKVAKEDIVVYKHLMDLMDGRYATPYQHDPVEIPSTVKSRVLERLDNEIYEGIHSFADYESAYSDMEDEWHNYSEPKRSLVKCIIPKGTKYYKGKFEGMPAYASKKLKYVEVLKTLL